MTQKNIIAATQTDLNKVWALIQVMPDEQRIEAQNALLNAYHNVVNNVAAMKAMAVEIAEQRDKAIHELSFISKNRGHISYDDVARDMSMEIDDLTYEEARMIVDVLCGQSDYATTSWDVMDLREALRALRDDLNENQLLEAEYEREIAEQAEFD